MKLYAISDLHISYKENWKILLEFPSFPDDWLILAGDICESLLDFEKAIALFSSKFKKLIWVPGNHELWTDSSTPSLLGLNKYYAFVKCCQNYSVITPEDDYVLWEGLGGSHLIVPLFLLYDYSFAPKNITSPESAILWATETGVMCADEQKLSPYPYKSKKELCHARCMETITRLEKVSGQYPIIFINHFPFKQSLIRLFLMPRFSIWCGTTITENWAHQYFADIMVYGHLHVPTTDWISGIRYEEVSLGYPKQWKRRNKHVFDHIREILPGPPWIENGTIYHYSTIGSHTMASIKKCFD